MVDFPGESRPPLRPVLRFTKSVRPESIVGGGKSRDGIKLDRLEEQRVHLSLAFKTLSENEEHFVDYNGRTLLCISMFEDSFAPSWTPSDLFSESRGANFVVPYKDGYLVQFDTSSFHSFPSYIESANSVVDQVDISRIRTIKSFSSNDILNGLSIEEMWERSPNTEGGKLILARLLPLKDADAGEEMIDRFRALRGDTIKSPGTLLEALGDERLPITSEDRAIASIRNRGDRLSLAVRNYRRSRKATTSVVVESPASLEALVASATVFKIEPAPKLFGATSKVGKEPDRPLPENLDSSPVVGVVDGGLTALSYQTAVAWESPPLVKGRLADNKHGNQVTSLVVQGHDWNDDLLLPKLYCRIGVAQAISKLSKGVHLAPNTEDFLAYLEANMIAHPETLVWNLSMNQLEACETDWVSNLGHEIALLARKYGKLPVISVGNGVDGLLKPPADCEAALTVGGHLATIMGAPGDCCPISRPGPGPAAMLKPEVSNFSNVRVIGGAEVKGSSFATALTSPLAAHTIMRLAEPTPDMVRALMINSSESGQYCLNRGFGSASRASLPWECGQSSATLMWEAELKAGAAYYWDIPIPSALVEEGKLSGFGALTAVLNPHPLVDDNAGPNYFGVRVNTALQYQNAGNAKSLLGKMNTDEMPEMTARTNEHKWSPIRHHQKKFGKNGLSFEGKNFRVYSRLYLRDLYAWNYSSTDQVPPFTVSFVLTLKGNNDKDVYGDVLNDLRDYVESGVISTDIDVDVI